MRSSFLQVHCASIQRACYSTQEHRIYGFSVGASFAGKAPLTGERKPFAANRFPPSGNHFRWTRTQFDIKKRLPFKDAGEDAFFIQEMNSQSGVAIGVADGVGGWSGSGIDPGVFSQALMYHSARYSKRAWAGESDTIIGTEDEEESSTWELTPEQCLRLAYDAVLRDRLVVGGSSTGLVATLNARSGLMKAANLGDSGFVIIRNNVIVYNQEPQTHFFNCPRQLAKVPPRMRRDGAIEDRPEDADCVSISLRHGDVVLAYTDGVSDNVWPAELTAITSIIMRQGGSEQAQVQEIADAVVEYAQQCMKRMDKASPFEVSSYQTGQPLYGGKEDDATVIAVLVSEGVHDPVPGVPIV